VNCRPDDRVNEGELLIEIGPAAEAVSVDAAAGS
jgi:hypothetical protein